MNIKKSIVFIGLLFFGVTLGMLFSIDAQPVYSDESESYNRAYWDMRLQKSDTQAVYNAFKEKNASALFNRQHLSTHIIGELLYEHEGLAGIRYCDASFSFGCYHGFFGRAISEEGVSAISELDAQCVEAYSALGTGCQHGIGHGIMEYVGYDSVSKALELCKQTTQITRLLGCTSGVFMEYNTPLIVGPDGEIPKPRVFDEQNPYTPCTEISTSFQESCYFELGQWFAQVFNSNTKQQGELCDSATSQVYRDRCFMGIGMNLVPSTEHDVSRIREQCAAFSAAGEIACLAGASWGFYSDEHFRSKPESFCVVLSSEKSEYCLQLADLTEGLEGN